jgi:competence ComEA-like helix-hairpin-helix protein
VFTFESSPDAVKKLESFFPGSRAEAQSDGSIRVYLPGSSEPIILTPAGAAGTAAPADVTTPKVDINRASEADLAKLPGIDKKLAKAIVEQRKQSGGFATVDDLLKVPGVGAETLAKVAPRVVAEDPPSIAQRQTNLAQRQRALLDRADRTGYSDDSIDAISKLRPAQSTDPGTLDTTEQKIAAAEKKAGGKMDAKAKKALDNAARKLGKESGGLRTGSLAGVSDQVVGDALTRVSGRKNLGVEQLRGIIWAHLKGVPIEKFMDTAQGFGVAARNRALDTFGKLADAKVRNCERVLSDMAGSGRDFTGGLFTLDVARFGYGIDAIEAFEVRVEGPDGVREIDIVLKVGNMQLELKNWESWEYRTSLADAANTKKPGQFLVDMENGDFEPGVLNHHRYLFRYPAPETIANIRAYLREQLEIFMRMKGVSPGKTKNLLAKFDATPDLVTESKARADGAVPDAPKIPTALLMPTQPPKDDKDHIDMPAPPPVAP